MNPLTQVGCTRLSLFLAPWGASPRQVCIAGWELQPTRDPGLHRWKEAGLDCMTVVQDTVKTSVQQISDSAVRVDVQYVLRPSEDEALRAADIGASGVSEVILARQAEWKACSRHACCHDHAADLQRVASLPCNPALLPLHRHPDYSSNTWLITVSRYGG